MFDVDVDADDVDVPWGELRNVKTDTLDRLQIRREMRDAEEDMIF